MRTRSPVSSVRCLAHGRRPSRLLGLAFLAAILSGEPALAASDLGRLEFPNSGDLAAQEPFLRGVLLLHSFEYEDAREAFQQAQAIDPAFALAYWGEAMTHNHSLWRSQDRDQARAALAKLAPSAEERRARTPTERERGYLRAVEALSGEGTKHERDLAYQREMERLAREYPDDLEAAAFHALSILGTADGERDFRVYMRAAAVAEEVYRANPEHPGALHYLIHSYDDPVHAPLGLRAARVYARVAPAASHAQHMISHIYVALGHWDETVEANEKSFAVSEERARRKGLPSHERSHHALHWLEYGYLQQGRYRDARRTLDTMAEDVRSRGTKGDRWYFAAMRAAYAVETGRWEDVPASLGTEGVEPSGVAADLFTDGLVALRSGRPQDGRALLPRMNAPEGDSSGAHAGCLESGTYDGVSPRSHQVAAILALELEGMVLLAEGRPEEGLGRLLRAAEAEDELPFEYGPPDVVKPTHELLGEALLERGRPDEARAEFERALDRAPRRALSLLGLGRAAAAGGEAAAARAAFAELSGIWRRADAVPPEVRRVAAGLR